MMPNIHQVDRLGTVRELLANIVGGEVLRGVADEDQLFERMVLDSLHLITLVSSLEERFGVVVTPEDLVPENFQSIAAIAGLVDLKMQR
jgi:acyl carrier protein